MVNETELWLHRVPRRNARQSGEIYRRNAVGNGDACPISRGRATRPSSTIHCESAKGPLTASEDDSARAAVARTNRCVPILVLESG